MLREVYPAAWRKCANKSASIHPSCAQNQDQCFSSEIMQALGGNKEKWDGDYCVVWALYFMFLRSPLSEQSRRQFVFTLVQSVRAEGEAVLLLGSRFLFFESAVSFVSQSGLSWLCLQIISSCPFPFSGVMNVLLVTKMRRLKSKGLFFPCIWAPWSGWLLWLSKGSKSRRWQVHSRTGSRFSRSWNNTFTNNSWLKESVYT